MGYYSNVDELRTDALWRAGEPQDATSSFWAQSLTYLNRIQQTLMLGGAIAVGRDLATSAGIYAHVVDLPLTDWWWARKTGVLNTTAGQTATVTLTQGSTAVTFGATIASSVAGQRLQVPGVSTVPLIAAHTGGTASATLDLAWPEATQTAVVSTLLPLSYSLASDFLRFASVPYVHSTFAAGSNVASVFQRTQDWPLATIAQGPLTRAFLTGPQTIEVNSWDTRPYRFEYEYIAMPADLAAGGSTILPAHHRSVLAIGAAMLMAFDKGDNRAANLASEYRETVQRLVQEHRHMMSGGSIGFGTIKPRARGYRVRTRQPLGELFLI